MTISTLDTGAEPLRVAFLVSHPIQYYAPLHQLLARRDDIEVKVFFTWHTGKRAVLDRGFGKAVSWDVPLLDGYDYELVANTSSDPGTHHFLGLQNPDLVKSILAWRPDFVHITGWAWLSHLEAIYHLKSAGVKVLFRGDSHLLDESLSRWRGLVKRLVLRKVYQWPSAFLYTGQANARYYRAFDVEEKRLFHCPHSIDVLRFAMDASRRESEATELRGRLQFEPDDCVVLFSGKLEPKKCPIQLIQALLSVDLPHLKLLIVGDGELGEEVSRLAAYSPRRICRLPFQNQSKMPLVYRLADIFALPSSHQETWGLAVNEALACGRPVLVSDRVGCAEDVVDSSCGFTFSWSQPGRLADLLRFFGENKQLLLNMRAAAEIKAWRYDVAETESSLVNCIYQLLPPQTRPVKRVSVASATRGIGN